VYERELLAVCTEEAELMVVALHLTPAARSLHQGASGNPVLLAHAPLPRVLADREQHDRWLRLDLAELLEGASVECRYGLDASVERVALERGGQVGVLEDACERVSFRECTADAGRRGDLREIFTRLRAKGLDADVVTRYLDDCPVFDEPTRELVYDGVRRIFSGDTVGAVHVLVPRLEATKKRGFDLLVVRRLHEIDADNELAISVDDHFVRAVHAESRVIDPDPLDLCARSQRRRY
jgi:hypothetical protein